MTRTKRISMGANATTLSLHAWETFKIYSGKIHAAEAFMLGMPAGTPSGWDAR